MQKLDAKSTRPKCHCIGREWWTEKRSCRSLRAILDWSQIRGSQVPVLSRHLEAPPLHQVRQAETQFGFLEQHGHVMYVMYVMSWNGFEVGNAPLLPPLRVFQGFLPWPSSIPARIATGLGVTPSTTFPAGSFYNVPWPWQRPCGRHALTRHNGGTGMQICGLIIRRHRR